MAQQTNNIWIQQNKDKLEALKRQLIEYNYQGSYGGAIDLMKVNNMIDGAIIEILKLQTENEVLAGEVRRLTDKG